MMSQTTFAKTVFFAKTAFFARTAFIALGLGAIALATTPPPIAAQAVPSVTATPQPRPSRIPQTPIEDLKSAVRIDYEPLQQLLRAGNWEEANKMTSTLMLQAGGQLERGYLIPSDIQKFPCADLLTVDKLWRYYSRDRFGFSVQAGIWIRMRGQDTEDVQRFAGRVGWHRGIVNASLNAQRGHLPLRPGSGGGVADAASGEWIQAMPKRLSACVTPPKPKKVQPKKGQPKQAPNRTPVRSAPSVPQPK
jgi:GUN4-like